MDTQPTKLAAYAEQSEQLHDFLTDRPSWAMRWAVPSMAILLVLVLGLSIVVKYPDRLTATIVITTRTPPTSLVARASGRLHLYVREHQVVPAGTVLASLDNPTQLAHLRQVQHQLAGLHLAGLLPALPAADTLRLGELQPYYTDFVLKYGAYRTFMQLEPLAKEVQYTTAELRENERLLRGHQRRQSLLLQEVHLTQADYDRNAVLFKQKVIPATSLEIKERELLQAKEAEQAAALAIGETSLRIASLQKALNTYRLQYEEKRQSQVRAVAEAQTEMLSRITAWEQQYLLTAPQAGRVAFFTYWSDNQFVAAGSEVLTIVPEGQQEIIGRMQLPALNSAKVRPGQRVLIRLHDYQYAEFGTLTGHVMSISAVPKAQRYLVEVALPQQLVSSYHRQLQFRPEMQGTANIITEDLRLIERVYYQFRPAISN